MHSLLVLRDCFCSCFFLRLKSRWHVFACVLLAASVAGTSYAFGIFSEVFKNKLGFSQQDLSIISSCGSTGLYTQVITGQLIERFGAHSVLVLGAALIFGCNFYIWLAVQKLTPHSVPWIAIVWFLAQVGIACASSVCLVVSMRIFPSSVRGRIGGFSKAYFGISSAILASIASGFFGEASVDLILFVSIALPLVLIFAAVNANFLPEQFIPFSYETSRNLPTSLHPYLCHLVVLFCAILAIGATNTAISLDRTAKMCMGGVVAALVFIILLVPSLYGSRFLVSRSGAKGVIEGGIVVGGDSTSVYQPLHDNDDEKEDKVNAGDDDDGRDGAGFVNGAARYLAGDDDGSGGRQPSRDKLISIDLSECGADAGTEFRRQNVGGGNDEFEAAAATAAGTTPSTTEFWRTYGGSTTSSARGDSNNGNNAGAYNAEHVETEAGARAGAGAYQEETDRDTTSSATLAHDRGKSFGGARRNSISYYGRNVPLSEALRSWRIYTLMVVFTIIAGSGLLVINNIQAVAEAVHQSPSNFFVTVVSLANACGRISSGLLGDRLIKHGITRLQLLSAAALAMAGAQFLLSLGIPALLYVCLLIVGFMFGCAFSLVAVLCADIWGTQFIGSNYGFVDLSPIIGSYIFSTGLIAIFYPKNGDDDDDKDDDDDDGDANSCVGVRCFREAFLVTTVCGVFACVLCYVLHWYTPLSRLPESTHGSADVGDISEIEEETGKDSRRLKSTESEISARIQ